MSLALELTDDTGKLAGSLQLPPEGEIQAPEFCEPAADAILAASLTDTADRRELISVPDCGSQRLRFLWTAPLSDLGRVWFSGSAVSSDGEGDTEHDGVTDFGRVIDSPAVASSTSAQCGVVSPGAQRTAAPTLLGVLLAALGTGWLRRSRRRPAQAGARAHGM
jgi:hypothetical protein